MPLRVDTLADQTGGSPLILPLESIDEDPAQPRSEFDPESLEELAQTIKARGVRQPISVRPHPEEPGRWILNFGARRLRASRLAGVVEIPAFVDLALDTYDQIIENEQREGLKPIELARFVKTRMQLGESQAEVARLLGKSESYVTHVRALVDAPNWLLEVYRRGQCRGMLELYQLRGLHALAPIVVEEWIAAAESIGRSDLQRLKSMLHSSLPREREPAFQSLSSANEPGLESIQVNPPLELTSDREVSTVGLRTVQPNGQLTGALPEDRPRRVVTSEQPRFGLFAELDGELVEVLTDAIPDDREAVLVRALGTPPKQCLARSLRLVGFRTIEAP